MYSRDFCFWLQGFIEISDPKKLTEAQLEVIKNHLNLVFKHEIDPAMGDKEHQDELNSVHMPDIDVSDIFDDPRPSHSDVLVRC